VVGAHIASIDDFYEENAPEGINLMLSLPHCPTSAVGFAGQDALLLNGIGSPIQGLCRNRVGDEENEAMAFWDDKPLSAMTPEEWEALCDGCGRCCLLKLEDEDTGVIVTSDVRCTLLDGETCKCSDYPNRQKKVSDCIKLTPENVVTTSWIPTTCAYRRLAEGRGLAWWHPLISGDPETVVAVGVSVRGRTVSENDVKPGEWEDHAVDWPEWEPPDEI